jgi:predicted secreted protein
MMQRKTILLSNVFLSVLLSFSLLVLVEAEVSWVMWSQTYGGTEDDGDFHLVYVVETSDGGFAVASNTESFGAGSSDFWLIKLDASGNMEWNKTYGGADFDVLYSLILTSDGGFALAGLTGSFGVGNVDFWLVKTDSFGYLEWNQTYGGTESDIAYSLVETSDGGFALAGYTGSFGAGKSDFWLVKADRYGTLEWNQTYGGANGDVAYSLVETSDGGFALVGFTTSLGGDDADFWLVKTDESGNLEWSSLFGGEKADMAESIVQTSDGGYALVGTTESFASGWKECWLIKTDDHGSMEWEKTYGEGDADWGHSLIVTSDGGFALVGESNSFGAGGYDFWLVKTDGSGNIEWSRTYGGPERDSAESLVQTTDGGYVLAGNTLSFGAGGYDIWLVRTNGQGIPEFPSWLVLPLFLAASFVALFYGKRLYARLEHLS